jgi:hypothetical protein
MRRRIIGLAAFSLLLTLMMSLTGPHGTVRAQDDATPAADEATPVPEEEAAAAERIVTLVGWYTRDESGDFLTIGPLDSNELMVAGPGDATDRSLSGRIDFDAEDNDDLPRVTLGDTVLDAYPVYEDDLDSVQRWIYLNDDPALRPSTLVMQVEATAGPYENFLGTVTLISRSTDGSGVFIAVLTPPE